MANKKKKKKAALRSVLTVGCVVMGLVLAMLLSATVYAEYLLNQMNYYSDGTRETMSKEDAEAFLNQTDPDDENYTGREDNAEDVTLDIADEILPTSENVINILLIGADYQSGDVARSDSMILCTFNKTRNTITMTSFMRDMYVQIPGYYKNRINASYSIGGMKLLKDTLEHNFGLEVNGIVEIDFSHFEELIDLLGGVEIELSYMEAEFINLKNDDNLTQGVRVLNGKQALWYSRFRTEGGDFKRTDRQRIVLGKLIENYRNSSLTDLLAMMDDILPMVTTDMEKNEILSYVTGLFPMLVRAEVITQRIPAEGGYYMTKIDGKSVLVPDIRFNVQILKDTITE